MVCDQKGAYMENDKKENVLDDAALPGGTPQYFFLEFDDSVFEQDHLEMSVSKPEESEFPCLAKEDPFIRRPGQEKSVARGFEQEKHIPEQPSPRSAGQKRVSQIAGGIVFDVLQWLLVGLAAFLLVCFASIYILRFSVVSGHSMDPTLHDEQTIVLSKLPYIFGEIEYGDIVVIDRAEDRDRTFSVEFREMLQYSMITRFFIRENEEDKPVFWVKRVVGKEGDVISFENGKLYRNGVAVEEEYLYTQDISTYPDEVFTVGEGELFVMGDNRNNSLDSRFLTLPIKADHVVGKVVGFKS